MRRWRTAATPPSSAGSWPGGTWPTGSSHSFQTCTNSQSGISTRTSGGARTRYIRGLLFLNSDHLANYQCFQIELKAWQRGRTGYPLVDAAMRQLWAVGWMNNYMRHVVASFLISYLRISWVEGYLWFQVLFTLFKFICIF